MPRTPIRSRPLAAFALLAVLPPLAAQTSLDPIVVTPTRSAQTLKSVQGDVSIIDHDTLQRAGQRSLAEILSRQAGVQITSNGGPQSATAVYLRGAGGPQTLVLVDGMRINSATQAGVNWNALDPAVIERVEIVRGAAASLYGSDAMGGVINIITRRSGEDSPLRAWGNIGLGSFETFKANVGLAGAAAGWDYQFAAGYGRSGGYDNTYDSNFSHHPDRDGYQQHSFSGSLGYTWRPGQHLGLTAYYSDIDGDFDAGALHPATTRTRQQSYTLASTNELTSWWRSTLRAGYSQEQVSIEVYGSRYRTKQRSYSWQNDFQLADTHRLSALLERLEERPYSSMNLPVDRRNTNAAGLIYQGSVGAHNLQASVRHDRISGYGGKTTGSLAYHLDITDAWRVGVAGNTAFRAPTFVDLYSPFAPNPDLRPERSRNVEAMVQYRQADTRVSLTVFQNKFRDLIALDPARNWAAYNTDRATIRGLSLEGEHHIGDTTLRAGVDLLRPRNDLTGKDLQRRARQVYRVGVDHRIGQLTLGADLQLVGKRYEDAANTVRLAGYGLLDLHAAYAFSRHAEVQLRWNNVLDKRDHMTADGYRQPRSNVFLNLAWKM